MKRGGHLNGPVPTSLSNPRPKPRTLNQLTPFLTQNYLMGHPKFTSKCGRPKCRGCHLDPACKSKEKVKGAQKIKPSSDYRLITWRVVDPTPGLKFSGGFSATGILDYLASIDSMDGRCDIESNDGNENDDIISDINNGGGGDEYVHNTNCDVNDVLLYNDDDEISSRIDDDDDRLSFYEVGLVWQPMDGDDSWYLVDEL